MHILLTTFEFPPDVGGVGTSVHRIAHGLAQSDHQVTVVVFDDPLPSMADTTVHHEHLGRIAVYRIHPSTLNFLLSMKETIEGM